MLPEIILSNDSRTTKTDAIAIMHDKTKIARGSKRFLPKIKTYTVIELTRFCLLDYVATWCYYREHFFL